MLAVLGINVIIIVKSLYNHNTVAGFVSWNQDNLLMKLLDTVFQMSEIKFRFRG